MRLSRRDLTLGGVATALAVVGRNAEPIPKGSMTMYGLISQMMTASGGRDELVRILAEGTKAMPGCLSYVIALDATRDDAIWVTEVWSDKESHANSLRLPVVQMALAKGRPLITGMGARTETLPVAGA